MEERTALLSWAMWLPAAAGLATLLVLAVFAFARSRRSAPEGPAPAPKPSPRPILALILLLLFLGLPLILLVLYFVLMAPISVKEVRFESTPIAEKRENLVAEIGVPVEKQGPLNGPRDLELWLKNNALSPEGDRPAWVGTGGGSTWRSGLAFGFHVQARAPGPNGLLAGYSDLCQDSAEALKEASRAAARHLAVLSALTGAEHLSEGSAQERGRRWAVPIDAVVQAVRAFEAEAANLVARNTQDRFVEEIARPYGTLFRAAVLVSAPQEDVRALAERFRKSVLERCDARADARRQVLLAAAAALGMAVVVFLLYTFLNAGTKGYFAWPLRIVSIGTLLLLYLGLLYALDWFPG